MPRRRLRSRAQDPTDGAIRLEITPLIDVVFLLLAFFVLSPVLLSSPALLELVLPSITGTTDASVQAGQRQAVTLMIDDAGDLRIAGDPTPWPRLRARVEQWASADPQPRLIVAVSIDAPAGRLIELTDALQAAGLTEAAIVGMPRDPEAEPQSEAPQPPSPQPDAEASPAQP